MGFLLIKINKTKRDVLFLISGIPTINDVVNFQKSEEMLNVCI
ncbi:hypothetical protein EDP2_3904 [Enterobacter cloacae S611]|uniref:Uncharacterized protein n=1 Tax=Enterobacter cloacae S611 TaxID=1399146 RepID=A0ABN0QCK8_ENTCL|nr:hypothetical protein EDP2_3904 [Enterobacter cloacae S611]